MNEKTIIENTERYVKTLLANEGTGHDWWHIQRVRNNAAAIGKAEQADMFIVDLTVLLHDVGDRKVIDKDENDYTIAEKFLQSMDITVGTIANIMFIIKNMSFSQTLNTKVVHASKEFYVVQDADRLDAMGAIGIARAFAFGGKKGRPLYDPTKQPLDISTGKDTSKTESSSFNHFYEKLLLLKGLINTETARKIAEQRHVYMVRFMQQFLLEWRGER